MSLRRPALVLFDLDGTLVDTAPDLAWSVNTTLAELGLPPRDESRIRSWIGSGIEGLMHRALTDDINGRAETALYDRAIPIFTEIYLENVARRSRIYPGVVEALDHLQTQVIKLGCVTNKRTRYTEKLLGSLGLYDRFDIVVSGDTLAVKKPDPAPLLYAAECLAVEPACGLMVGDSVTDIRAARAAGLQVLCVPYGYNLGRDIHDLAPDAVVENLAELKQLI